MLTAAFALALSPMPLVSLVVFVAWDSPAWWGFVGLGATAAYALSIQGTVDKLVARYRKLRERRDDELR